MYSYLNCACILQDEKLIGKRLDEENNPFVSQKEGKAPKPTTPSIAE